jgi:hypothetical protein
MYSIDNIIEFLKNFTGNDGISPDSEICDGIGITGDDFHEMIDAYSKQFNVDISQYLWYFHTEDEGSFSIGGLLFTPPFKRVKRIRVTVKNLLDFANCGKWKIEYPDHKLPKRRYDLIFNLLIIVGLLIWGLISIIYHVIKK